MSVEGPEIAPSSSAYGPVRRRCTGKQPDNVVHRPPEMRHEDLSNLLNEIAIEDLTNQAGNQRVSDEAMNSPRDTSCKREASAEAVGHEDSRPRNSGTEALFCHDVLSCVSCHEIPSFDVLMSAFLQKRMQKEIPPSGNDPALQSKVDEAKRAEWQTLSEKPAVKVWTGAKAQQILTKHPDRFVGSRFAIVEKSEDQCTRIKARWCLQGHLDPDFREKITSGLCHSPTLSQLARALILQVLVSKKWTMCLGDVKGAFLEAGPLDAKFKPLIQQQ